MLRPRKTDGSYIDVTPLPDGRVFVNVEGARNKEGERIHRGGPEYPEHHHRWEDYGLSDGLRRCRKCGLVRSG